MPELPEVESVRRQLAPELTGRRVLDAWWDAHPYARLSDLELLPGRLVEHVARRGKFLVCTLDAGLELVLHLGMTGSLRFAAADAGGSKIDTGPDTEPVRPLRHVRVRLDLDDGRSLLFDDPRRFGRASVVPTGEYAAIPTLAALGPEPLEAGFTVGGLSAGLRASSAPVKARLLDQRLVAGVGNIYADEALWRARIHPGSRRVGRERAARLHTALREVLAAAIEREGTTFRDYRMVNGASGRYAAHLDAYGQAGEPCPRCTTPMEATVVAGRGTTYCPRCQRY